MMRYHGPHSPAGVAMAFKVMQRAFAALCPDGLPERRSITVRTAVRGPGARDGFVTDEFVDMARTENRTDAQEQRLDALKAQLAQRVMATPAADVYDVG